MSGSSHLPTLLAALVSAPVFLAGPWLWFTSGLDWHVALAASAVWGVLLYLCWRAYRFVAGLAAGIVRGR